MEIFEMAKQFIKHNPMLGVVVFIIGYYIKYRFDIKLQNSRILGFMQQVNDALKQEHGFHNDISANLQSRIEKLDDRIYNMDKAESNQYIEIVKDELAMLKEAIELLKKPKQ